MLREVYEKLRPPKLAIAVGACAFSGTVAAAFADER
jgi:Ni,Fe-hydrogenase III small subunit